MSGAGSLASQPSALTNGEATRQSWGSCCGAVWHTAHRAQLSQPPASCIPSSRDSPSPLDADYSLQNTGRRVRLVEGESPSPLEAELTLSCSSCRGAGCLIAPAPPGVPAGTEGRAATTQVVSEGKTELFNFYQISKVFIMCLPSEFPKLSLSRGNSFCSRHSCTGRSVPDSSQESSVRRGGAAQAGELPGRPCTAVRHQVAPAKSQLH